MMMSSYSYAIAIMYEIENSEGEFGLATLILQRHFTLF